MSARLSHGTSGAIRRLAGWVARGSVGHPILDGIKAASREELIAGLRELKLPVLPSRANFVWLPLTSAIEPFRAGG
ncbi:MAG: DUF7677 family protein [Pseudonocardiaceae bacterium]